MLALAVVYSRSASWWRLEKSLPWANVERVGELDWEGGGKSIDVAARALNLSGVSSWSMGPADDSVHLVSGDERALVKASTLITLTRTVVAAFTMSPGSPSYPLFGPSGALFLAPGAARTPEQISAHEGPLHVVNRIADPVEIRFQTAIPDGKLEKPYWTVDPEEETNLVLSTRGFTLTEGDAILLRRKGASAAKDSFVTIGGNPAVRWDAAARRWVLSLDTAALTPRTGNLAVRNPASYSVTLEALDRTGARSLGTWELPAGFGGTSGEVLQSSGSPFAFKEGYRLSVEPHDRVVLYDGAIGAYGGASWKDGAWTLAPP